MGWGLEALEFARAGNRVSLADLSPVNLQLAERVLGLFGFVPDYVFEISDKFPFINNKTSFDIFYCNGVLHHIPWARDVMCVAHDLVLRLGGEVRLMLYSDIGWRIATNSVPPENVTSHPKFEKFVRHFDAVGDYADWYNSAKLKSRFGDLFNVVRCEYLTPEKIYLAAVLRSV